jgi:hypothetical protein
MARSFDQPARLAVTVLLALAAWELGQLVASAVLIALTDTPLALNTSTDTVPIETFLMIVFHILLAFAVAAAVALPLGRSLLRAAR